MTGRSPVVCLAGFCLALLLSACAGSEVGANTADAAAAAAARPGGPGGDPAGDDGTDTQPQGNPGAPGDVAVFEEAGVPHSVLRDDAASKCAGGVCTLLDPVVGAGDPEDLGGVDECLIQEQSDIRYDPPAEDGLFRKGASVQATVDCSVEDSGSDSSGDTSEDPQPTDEPQG